MSKYIYIFRRKTTNLINVKPLFFSSRITDNGLIFNIEWNFGNLSWIDERNI